MTPMTFSDWLLGLIPIVILMLLWLTPVLIAFSRLRMHVLDDTAKAVWTLIILILPIIGPITYLVLFSERQKTDKK
jgi:hypothetical protein